MDGTSPHLLRAAALPPPPWLPALHFDCLNILFGRMLAEITLWWLSLATRSFCWHRPQGDGSGYNSGIKGEDLRAVKEDALFQNTWESLGTHLTRRVPKLRIILLVRVSSRLLHLTALQSSLPSTELLSVVPVKMFLHQPSQPHRIWLVLQLFPFMIFRLGKMWHALTSAEKQKYLDLGRLTAQEHGQRHPGKWFASIFCKYHHV